MNTSRSYYPEEDYAPLYTSRSYGEVPNGSRPEYPRKQPDPRNYQEPRNYREPRNQRYHDERPTPKYSKPRVPPISVPVPVPMNIQESEEDYDDSPARPLTQSQSLRKIHPREMQCVERKKPAYIVPGDEPISPVFFPKNGAVNLKTRDAEIESMHGNAASFKYDKPNGKVHLVVTGRGQSRFKTNEFELILDVQP